MGACGGSAPLPRKPLLKKGLSGVKPLHFAIIDPIPIRKETSDL